MCLFLRFITVNFINEVLLHVCFRLRREHEALRKIEAEQEEFINQFMKKWRVRLDVRTCSMPEATFQECLSPFLLLMTDALKQMWSFTPEYLFITSVCVWEGSSLFLTLNRFNVQVSNLSTSQTKIKKKK